MTWLLNSMIDITALDGYTLLTLLTIGAALYRIARRDRVTAFGMVAAIGSGAVMTQLPSLG